MPVFANKVFYGKMKLLNGAGWQSAIRAGLGVSSADSLNWQHSCFLPETSSLIEKQAGNVAVPSCIHTRKHCIERLLPFLTAAERH